MCKKAVGRVSPAGKSRPLFDFVWLVRERSEIDKLGGVPKVQVIPTESTLTAAGKKAEGIVAPRTLIAINTELQRICIEYRCCLRI